MNRFNLFSVCVLGAISLPVLFTGCGKTSDTGQQASVEQVLDLDVTTESEFEAEFRKLTEAAIDLEKANDWEAAIKQWQSVIALTTAEFGEDSWQTRNAQLAVVVATRRRGFSDSDRANSEQIAEHQRATKQLLQEGNIVDAITESEKTIDLAREVWGADSHVTANFDEQHAQLLRASGNYQVAADYFLETIRKREQALTKTHPDYERVVFDLGTLYSQIGQYGLAEQQFRSAGEVAKNLWGKESIQTARAKNEIAVTLHRKGDLENAAKAATEAATIRRRQLGADSDLFAHSLLNIGVIRLSQKDYESAATNLSLASKIADNLGDSQQNMQLKTDVYSNAGTVELLQSDFVKAEESFRKLTETTKGFFGKEHPVHAGSLLKLAVAIGNQGRFEDAEPVMVESIAIQRKLIEQESLSPTHPDYVRSVQSYARLLEQLGRTEEARTVLASVRNNDFKPARVAESPESPGSTEVK